MAAVGAAWFLVRHVAVTGEAYYSQFKVTIDQELLDGTSTHSQNNSQQYGLQFGIRAFLF